jgi:ubiquitin C-terminal hydrolase
MWSASEALAGYQQQDAHEFLIALLDGLHVGLTQCAINERQIERIAALLQQQRATQVCGEPVLRFVA